MHRQLNHRPDDAASPLYRPHRQLLFSANHLCLYVGLGKTSFLLLEYSSTRQGQ